MAGLEPLLNAFRLVGEDPSQVLTEHNAYLVAYGHDVLGLHSVPGVILVPERNSSSASGCRTSSST
jgi:hypothetical protein